MFSSTPYIVCFFQSLFWSFFFFFPPRLRLSSNVQGSLMSAHIEDTESWLYPQAGQSSSPCERHITARRQAASMHFYWEDSKTASPQGHSLGPFGFSKQSLQSPSWETGWRCSGNKAGSSLPSPCHSFLRWSAILAASFPSSKSL